MLYILCIFSVLLFSNLADKLENRFYTFICAFILSAFCGLRGKDIGVDTIYYFKFWSYIRELGISYGSDIGFSAISYFLMRIFKDPYYLQVIFATITNFFITYRLWDFRKEASFPIMLFFYMVVYYPYSFNIIRQFLAISLIFWATHFIEKGEYKKYIVANIIASTIHASALMCFSYLFFTFGRKTEKKGFKILGFAMAIVFIIIGMYIFNSNMTKYENHLVIVEIKFHAMTIFKLLCWLMVVIFNGVYRNEEFSITKDGEIVPMKRGVATMYVIGLGLSAFGMFFAFMNRIGFYFLMNEMPFWGQSIRVKTNKKLYRFVVFAIIFYILIIKFFGDENADNLFYYKSFIGNM